MQWNAQFYDQSFAFVSQYGENLLGLLSPRVGESILDLGCGTGDLSFRISESGAKVTGIDHSAAMIGQAVEKYPQLTFYQMDATSFSFERPFDAIFSNAVLHWVPQKEMVIRQMAGCLKPGGRIVAEFGGKGNIQQLESTLSQVMMERNFIREPLTSFYYFPTPGEYATELEKAGFRVLMIRHFDRPTPLQGENGIVDWFKMFGNHYLSVVDPAARESLLLEVQGRLKDSLYKEGVWYADYKRLQVLAIKP